MMLQITIVDMLTGEIKRRVSCPDVAVQEQVGDGEGYILGDVDDSLYTVDIETGEPILKPIIEPVPPTLQELKVVKAAKINLAARTHIYSGYDSDALGAVHHYPANDKDQLNMIASVTDSYNPLNDVDWVTPFWSADLDALWNYRMHTAAQIQKAGSDGKAFITQTLGKNAWLQAQIQAATTEESLALIVW